MIDYQQQPSALQKLTGTIELSAEQASVIKQTYILLGVSIFCAIAGGYLGATTPGIVSFFSTRIGWVVAILMLNAVPMIARAAQNNPVLGVTALVANGLVAGIAMAPLLWVASTYDPQLIYLAFAVTACVFLGITGYVMMSGRSFSAPRGMMAGLFLGTIAIILLNSYMHIGWLGIVASFGIGVLGVCAMVYSTSSVLRTPAGASPIPGALNLFAGMFNVFVATLNILLRVLGGGRRN